MQNGIQHNGSIAGTFHVLKYFNWTTGIIVTDRNYFSTVRSGMCPAINPVKIHCGRHHPAICQCHRRECINITQHKALRDVPVSNTGRSLPSAIWYLRLFLLLIRPISVLRHGLLCYAVNDTNKIRKNIPFFRAVSRAVRPHDNPVWFLFVEQQSWNEGKSRKDTVTGTKKDRPYRQPDPDENYDMTKDTNRWSTLSIQGYTPCLKLSGWLMAAYGIPMRGIRWGIPSGKRNGKSITGCSGSIIHFGIWVWRIHFHPINRKRKKPRLKEQSRNGKTSVTIMIIMSILIFHGV